MELQNNIKLRLLETYRHLININKLNSKIYEIELPLFLNTGDAIDIQLILNKNEVVLKNTLYKQIEDALVDKCSIQQIRKDYFLNEKKFISLKNELSKNNIETSLLLEKRIDIKCFKEELEREIFLYAYLIIRYYNYIYDYLIEKLSEQDQAEIFKNEVQKFIDYINVKNKNVKFNAIIKEEYEVVSTYNTYYKHKAKIITGINSKIHFLEAMMDINKIREKEENKELKTYILIDKRKKSDITDIYLDKMLKNENNIEVYKVKEMSEFNKIEESLEELMRNEFN